jgi:hypothetical protein
MAPCFPALRRRYAASVQVLFVLRVSGRCANSLGRGAGAARSPWSTRPAGPLRTSGPHRTPGHRPARHDVHNQIHFDNRSDAHYPASKAVEDGRLLLSSIVCVAYNGEDAVHSHISSRWGLLQVCELYSRRCAAKASTGHCKQWAKTLRHKAFNRHVLDGVVLPCRAARARGHRHRLRRSAGHPGQGWCGGRPGGARYCT